jgi:hypothetical protein
LLELADARSHFGLMTLDELEHMSAGWRSAVADADYLANFRHRQPDRLRRPNECQARQSVASVVAVARYRSCRSRQQARLLVIAQRRCRETASTRKLANSHFLTLEHTPMFTLSAMPELNTTSASLEPEPLIGEAVADSPGAALSRAAFVAILEGHTPLLSDLVEATAASAEAVDGLIGRGLMLDETGHVVAAHGLSLVPARQHRLTIGDRQFWTWCAIDVIGIPAGRAADAVAETTCHVCGIPVRVEFRTGEIVRSSYPAARVWNAQRLPGRGAAGPPHCALMNLYCSDEHLADWLATHPDEAGHACSLAEAVELGRAEWAAVVNGRNCGPDECCP